MVEPSILNILIKTKHHFVKIINLQSFTESYQPNRRQVWSIDTLAKPFKNIA